jgi:hypothetical protein
MSTNLADTIRRGREEAEEAKEAKLLGELPPPVQKARPLTAEEWPTTAKSMAKLAKENGWDSVTTFADGYMVGGKPKRHLRVQSVLVTMRKQVGGVTVATLAACWMKRLDKAEQKWEFDFAWGARRGLAPAGGGPTRGGMPLRKLKSHEARAFLKGDA